MQNRREDLLKEANYRCHENIHTSKNSQGYFRPTENKTNRIYNKIKALTMA